MSVFDELREVLLEKLRKGEDPFPEIIGNLKAKHDALSCLIAGRHFLILGPAGVGKTTLAKSIAKLLPPIKVPKGVPYWLDKDSPFIDEETRKKFDEAEEWEEIPGYRRFVRIQGSPDLTPEDLVGTIDPAKALREGINPRTFIPGKLFRANHGVLFFDELNRAPPKIQNLLLQVLEEGYVSLGPFDIEVPTDFIFIATMNPQEYQGVYEVSEALLDRLDLVRMDYPETLEIEKEIVLRKGKKLAKFPDKLLRLMIQIIRDLRKDENLEVKPSPRAVIGLYERAQANALIRGSEEVEWVDIEEALLSVLGSRIRLKPNIAIKKSPIEYLKEKLENLKPEEAKEESKKKV